MWGRHSCLPESPYFLADKNVCPTMMSSVLVTGATGFIGLHLVEALVERGDHVRCLVRPTSIVEPLRQLGVELVTASFGDADRLRSATDGVDVVYHAAGIIRAFQCAEFYRANEQGTAQITAACAAQANPPRLVLISSIAASGPAPRGQLRIEADPPAPISHYGRSKLAAEQAAAKFAQSVPLTIVRPGIVFGPRDTGFVKVIQSIRTFYCHLSPGFHPPALSYIHVSDLIELLLRAAERGGRAPADENGKPGAGCYFAVAREHPTYAELGRILRPMLGRPRAPIIPVAAPLAYCVAGLSELCGRLRGKPEELCIDKIHDALAPSWACSGEAARRELDFLPAKSLTERLQETVDCTGVVGPQWELTDDEQEPADSARLSSKR
jgi:dihydroflavonol-4-reductase